jgi:predicted site-specific integrase-resolvase
MSEIIGYARVSSASQNLDAQRDALTQTGCVKTFTDKASGANASRPGWHELLAYLRPGDTVVITELSRMSRSLVHLLDIVQALEERHVELKSLRERIDTATAAGRAFLSIIGAIAQMEVSIRINWNRPEFYTNIRINPPPKSANASVSAAEHFSTISTHRKSQNLIWPQILRTLLLGQ